MATKKQKHADALKKREEDLAELKHAGLKAQKKDHERKERRRLVAENEAQEIHKKQQAIRAAHTIHKEN